MNVHNTTGYAEDSGNTVFLFASILSLLFGLFFLIAPNLYAFVAPIPGVDSATIAELDLLLDAQGEASLQSILGQTDSTSFATVINNIGAQNTANMINSAAAGNVAGFIRSAAPAISQIGGPEFQNAFNTVGVNNIGNMLNTAQSGNVVGFIRSAAPAIAQLGGPEFQNAFNTVGVNNIGNMLNSVQSGNLAGFVQSSAPVIAQLGGPEFQNALNTVGINNVGNLLNATQSGNVAQGIGSAIPIIQNLGGPAVSDAFNAIGANNIPGLVNAIQQGNLGGVVVNTSNLLSQFDANAVGGFIEGLDLNLGSSLSNIGSNVGDLFGGINTSGVTDLFSNIGSFELGSLFGNIGGSGVSSAFSNIGANELGNISSALGGGSSLGQLAGAAGGAQGLTTLFNGAGAQGLGDISSALGGSDQLASLVSSSGADSVASAFSNGGVAGVGNLLALGSGLLGGGSSCDTSNLAGLVSSAAGAAVSAASGAGLFVPVKDAAQIAQNERIILELNSILSEAKKAVSLLREICQKELTADSQLHNTWAAVIAQFVEQTRNFVNRGFLGNPIFLTNQHVYEELVNVQVTRTLLIELARSNIHQTALREIAQTMASELFHSRFPYQGSLTLADPNIPTNLTNNFENAGGYDRMLKNITDPTDSIGNLIPLIREEWERRMHQQQEFEDQKLDWGRGFFSFEDCDLAVYSADIQEDRRNCRISTPGSLIQDQVSFVFGSALRQMELADELDEWVAPNTLAVLSDVLSTRGLNSRPGSGSRGAFIGTGLSLTPSDPQSVSQAVDLNSTSVNSAIYPRELVWNLPDQALFQNRATGNTGLLVPLLQQFLNVEVIVQGPSAF